MELFEHSAPPSPEALSNARQASERLLESADKGVSGSPAGRSSAGEFDGFSQCDEPVEQWKLFYRNGWQDIRDNYIYPESLKNWADWEHKFDLHMCSLPDLDLAMKHMTDSVHNKWTRYLSAAEQDEKERLKSQGLVPGGMEFRKNGDKYEIEFIHYASAAQSAPLREGDVVLSINGRELKGLSLEEARAASYGARGAKMQVQTLHEGNIENLDLTLKDIPERVPIEGQVLPDGVAYIRLPDFNGDKRIEEFVDKLNELKKSSGNELKGLVLDLRNDPGGDFPNAVNVASMFLPAENMLIAHQFVRSRDPQDADGLTEKTFRVGSDAIKVNSKAVDPELINQLRKVPMAVLTNGSTVSASEVLTGALKDNGRAVIVGTRTFGKGVGYREQRFPTGAKFSISQMKYTTPSGFDPTGKGIEPDLKVERQGNRDSQLEAALEVLAKQRSK